MNPEFFRTVAEAVEPTVKTPPTVRPEALMVPDGSQEPPVEYWTRPAVVEFVEMAPLVAMITSRVLKPMT